MKKNVPDKAFKVGIDIMSKVHYMRMSRRESEDFEIGEKVLRIFLRNMIRKTKRAMIFLLRRGMGSRKHYLSCVGE